MRKFLVLALVLCGVSLQAHAQWAVIDATNLKQNITNTISTYAQELAQAEMLLNQYTQLENEYKQLQSLGDSVVSGILGTITTARTNQTSYVSALQSMYGDVSSAKDVSDAVYDRMAASGLSPTDWMARETERNQATKQGNGYLSNYQVSVLQQVGSRYDEVKTLQSKINTTTGVHESLQLLNSQMNALLAAVNQTLEQNAMMAQYMLQKDMAETGSAAASVSEYQTAREADATRQAKVVSQIKAISN
jgi:P-type conjugative transfer protein TrbJ